MVTAPGVEDNHLAGLHVGKAVDAGDTVPHADDLADLGVLAGRLGGGGGDARLEVVRELDHLVKGGVLHLSSVEFLDSDLGISSNLHINRQGDFILTCWAEEKLRAAVVAS